MSFELSSRAIRLEDRPPESAIISLGRDILDSTGSWTEGRRYANGKILTLRRPKKRDDPESWYCRVSKHGPDDATFDEFWSKLGENKVENERQYITAIKKAVLVKQISATQSVWSMHYTYPFPVSPRIFTVLLTTHIEKGPRRSGYVLALLNVSSL